MAKIHKQLEMLGLNEKEAKTYLALLEVGEGTLADLVRKAVIKRTTLYDVLRSLKDKGLVSTSRSGARLLYIAEDPRSLDDRLEEQQSVLSSILPELLAMANMLPRKPKMQYYEGIEGIKEVYRDMLRYPDQKMCAWVSDSMITNFDDRFIDDYYIPMRLENRMWANVIASDTSIGIEFKSKDSVSLRETKLLDATQFPLSIELTLYGSNRIGFMSIEDKLGLIVESKPIADTLRTIFKQQWESLPIK